MKKKQENNAQDRWLILLIIIPILLLILWRLLIRRKETPIESTAAFAPIIPTTVSSGSTYNVPVVTSNAGFDMGFDEGFTIE